MPSVSAPIVDVTGKQIGSYEFDSAELAGEINKQLLHDVVVMYEANKRVGTVRTKTRSEVSGSTRKLYRQKGTGNARAGSKRSPTRVGGGHAFAKRPQDWGYRLPKKAVRLATRMALLSKFQDGEAVVLDDLKLTATKTKAMVAVLKALGVSKQSTLLAIAKHDPEIWRTCRNLEKLWVSPAADLNAYDLLHQRRLVVTKAAMDALRAKKKEVES